MVAQVVGLALFEVLKYFRLGGAIIPLIPITAFVKVCVLPGRGQQSLILFFFSLSEQGGSIRYASGQTVIECSLLKSPRFCASAAHGRDRRGRGGAHVRPPRVDRPLGAQPQCATRSDGRRPPRFNLAPALLVHRVLHHSVRRSLRSVASSGHLHLEALQDTPRSHIPTERWSTERPVPPRPGSRSHALAPAAAQLAQPRADLPRRRPPDPHLARVEC